MQSVLDALAPGVGRVVSVGSVAGGCISAAHRVAIETDDGPAVWFVKGNDEGFLENFRCESSGLERLHAVGAVAVPKPIAVGLADDSSWLITTWVEPRRPTADFFQVFGRQLAALHRQTRGTEVGLDHDNFLGSARQLNGSRPNWIEFVAEQRIGFQLRWAREQRLASDRLIADGDRVRDQIGDLLSGREDATSLLHGDLWSGNYLCRADGQPVLIDPAVYYGCREAEFGMLKLFGSCPERFYAAYDEAFPLADGWQRRVNVYVFYHLLNHLNLFGSGYLGQCEQTVSLILRS